MPSSESKANVGCYEYHFSMKGIDKRCFLVVQVVLVGKECMKGTDPKNVKGKKKLKEAWILIWPSQNIFYLPSHSQ